MLIFVQTKRHLTLCYVLYYNIYRYNIFNYQEYFRYMYYIYLIFWNQREIKNIEYQNILDFGDLTKLVLRRLYPFLIILLAFLYLFLVLE